MAREDGILLFSSGDLFRLDDLSDLKWIIGYEDITEAALQVRPDLNTLFRQQYDSSFAFSPDAVVDTALSVRGPYQPSATNSSEG